MGDNGVLRRSLLQSVCSDPYFLSCFVKLKPRSRLRTLRIGRIMHWLTPFVTIVAFDMSGRLTQAEQFVLERAEDSRKLFN